MAIKAYFMINVAEEDYKNGIEDILKDLETIAEVKAAERVSGFCDLLVKVQAPTVIIRGAKRCTRC